MLPGLPTVNNGLRVNRNTGAQSVLTLATGEVAASSEVRTETMLGREYTVVPVVAIVEGVLQGANAKTPEFAAAEEFGKFPHAWDGRPVVMNHPQINGVFVSAGIPQVLEEFGLGMIFNSRLEDSRLKCEAWLDHTRIEEIGGEALETLERIRNGETVEVSVGAWITSIPRPGTFAGKQYASVWSHVAPDHLAFLSKGIKGACSVQDGCGVPRLNQAFASIGATASCCTGCAEGSGCTSPGHTHESADAVETLASYERTRAFTEQRLAEMQVEYEASLNVNAVPGTMAFQDVAVIVRQGLIEILNIPEYDFYIEALTMEGAVYRLWGKPGLWMRTFTIDDNGAIEFAEEESPVNLLTRIVPRQLTEVNVNQQENAMTTPGSGATPSTGDAGSGTAPAPAPTPTPTPPAGTPAPGDDAGNNNTSSPSANAEAPSFATLLAAADPATRESIEHGQRMLAAHRNGLIAGIKGLSTNKFSDEQLAAFDTPTLETLSATIGQPATFAGRAVPGAQLGVDQSTTPKGPSVSQANVNYLSGEPSTSTAAAA